MEGRYLRSYTGRGDENGVVEIPDDLGITYIYQYAFFDNDYITKIILPEGLEEIEEAAIYGCENLTEVVFPDSVKQVNRFALAWNPNLTTVTGQIPTIGELAFYNCPNLTNIDLSGTMFIEANAFFGDSSPDFRRFVQYRLCGISFFRALHGADRDHHQRKDGHRQLCLPAVHGVAGNRNQFLADRHLCVCLLHFSAQRDVQ